MRWRKCKPVEPSLVPEPWPEPDLILDGKRLWVARLDTETLARKRAEADTQRAIARKRLRESHPAPFGMWMDW